MNEVVAPPAVSVPSVTPAEPIVFSGVRSDFRRLVLRGALLELVTVGFYRFWLATDMRRHLWSHTSIAGDALEYTGTAKELLIGFLFALAVLVPIYLVYTLIGIQAEQMQAFASIPLVLFYYLFAQFASYRARRYRLTRTIWRGVRFWMTGSGWAYAWRASLWTLLAVFTLGLALPWRAAALERFKMRHSFYGDLAGRFEGTGWEFFKRGWWLWLLAWFATLVPFALPFIYAAFKAVEWRWWVSGIRFGDVAFKSELPGGALIGLYWKAIGWGLLLLLVLSLWVAAAVAVAMTLPGTSDLNGEEVARALQHPAALAATAFGYVVAALALGMVLRIYLLRDVWARVASTATVYNLAAADNVTARGELVNALGEGFADSLDVAGF